MPNPKTYESLQSIMPNGSEHIVNAPFNSLIEVYSIDLFQVVLVRFLKFELEFTDDCRYDYLSLYDNRRPLESELIEKVCTQEQNNLPENIVTTGRYVSLRFISDHVEEFTGFRLVISYEDPEGKEVSNGVHVGVFKNGVRCNSHAI